jgi:hypothetical protein
VHVDRKVSVVSQMQQTERKGSRYSVFRDDLLERTCKLKTTIGTSSTIQVSLLEKELEEPTGVVHPRRSSKSPGKVARRG